MYLLKNIVYTGHQNNPNVQLSKVRINGMEIFEILRVQFFEINRGRGLFQVSSLLFLGQILRVLNQTLL